VNHLRAATPDRREGTYHEVNPGGIAPPNAALPLERNELLLYLDNFCLDKREIAHRGLPNSGPCFRHFGLDDRRQSVNAFEVFMVEVVLHQLYAEVPLNL